MCKQEIGMLTAQRNAGGPGLGADEYLYFDKQIGRIGGKILADRFSL